MSRPAQHRHGPHLTVIPMTFDTACLFVEMWHRHLLPPIGHKFSIGVVTDDLVLRGVGMVGRPISRYQDDGQTLEVNRTATDGTVNANSALYGASWRAAKALGYTRLITYTQEGEGGVSLRAASFRVVARREAHQGWDRPSRPRTDKAELIPRTLWEAS